MRQERSAERRAVAGHDGSQHPRRLRVQSLLLLVVLIPTFGLVVLAATSASTTWADRQASVHLQEGVRNLAAIADGRAVVASEATQSSVVSIASDLGLGIEELSDFYGIDYRAVLDDARTAVDQARVLQSLPEVAAELARLAGLRADLDAGTATFEQTNGVFDDLGTALDAMWRERFAGLHSDLMSESLPGSVHERLEAMHSAFEALSWGNRRASLSVRLLQGASESVTVAELLDAQSEYDAAIEGLAGARGALVATALDAHQSDAAGRRFEATLAEVIETELAGGTSPLATDPFAFGEAFGDGAPWGESLTVMVRAAATDLRELAAAQAHSATRDLQIRLGLAALLTVLALASTVLVSRSVVRPIRRLEAAARQIHDGRFDIDPIEAGGPRELADTASAFNDMAFTLAAVEAHAVALADDPDAPILDIHLPGRTGRALQVALNRLRSSIRGAEKHRRDLQEAATHDGLTGLLNRTAAYVMIERDMSRAEREGGRVMALFIDLDGLKLINDVHGHAAGDDALCLTADALRATTRSSDVVARIGGDEFLVAGIVTDEVAEVGALAERIRQAVADREVACPEEQVPLRCSIGVAVTEPGDDTVESLVRKADAALYVAKTRGRDRVAWHEDPHNAER